MMYECINRIFGRQNHDCLSSANKPKVIEVILKFTKLYDGVDFESETISRGFDDFIRLDFFNYTPLHDDTIAALQEALQRTPSDFESPSDLVI